jgi:sigma-B regulation protein RsbU (phosphoserine phosphatase)
MAWNLPVTPETILDSLGNGLYITDKERRILLWSKRAEEITGWPADEVIGKRCCDSVLEHIDKDGHPLCGKEHCPLHRAMETNRSAETPVIVFAKSKKGPRVPMHVSVAPLHDEEGNVVGGVETFQDLRGSFHDIQRAQNIQLHTMASELPDDPRVQFTTHYIPQDIVGGDFCHIRAIDENRYAFLLADVTGHGTSAALYTMYISLLLREHGHLEENPAELAAAMNNHLCTLVQEESFAVGTVGLVDLEANVLHCVACGNPPGLRLREGQEPEILGSGGLPWGILPDAEYDTTTLQLDRGDCILLYSDGATEVFRHDRKMLDVDGLAGLITEMGYPAEEVKLQDIEERLLKWSNDIRLPDDLTLLEIRAM